MAIRIVGVDIPQNKCGEVSLTYIYGIGRSSAKKILAEAGIDPSIKVENWTDDQAAKVREIIGAKFKVEGDLRSETQLNSSFGNTIEHQAFDGYRLLPWCSSPYRSARTWTEHKEQRPHAQRT